MPSGIHTPPKVIDGLLLKWCNQCDKHLPLDTFGRYKGGINTECRICNATRSRNWYAQNKEKAGATSKEWRENNKHRVYLLQKQYRRDNKESLRDKNLQYKYGITSAQYDAMLAKQKNVCAICNKKQIRYCRGSLCRLSVDHDHSCCPGEKSCGRCVRALLCNRCNTAIGLLKDDEQIIDTIPKYIAEHRRRITNG